VADKLASPRNKSGVRLGRPWRPWWVWEHLSCVAAFAPV